jgi:hypothetical protein
VTPSLRRTALRGARKLAAEHRAQLNVEISDLMPSVAQVRGNSGVAMTSALEVAA